MERHLTINEVADRLRTSVFTVRRRLREHPEIRPIRTGRSIVFDAAALAALEEALRPPPISSPFSDSSFSEVVEKAVKLARKRRHQRLRAAIREVIPRTPR
jgi:hypothetical protein